MPVPPIGFVVEQPVIHDRLTTTCIRSSGKTCSIFNCANTSAKIFPFGRKSNVRYTKYVWYHIACTDFLREQRMRTFTRGGWNINGQGWIPNNNSRVSFGLCWISLPLQIANNVNVANPPSFPVQSQCTSTSFPSFLCRVICTVRVLLMVCENRTCPLRCDYHLVECALFDQAIQSSGNSDPLSVTCNWHFVDHQMPGDGGNTLEYL